MTFPSPRRSRPRFFLFYLATQAPPHRNRWRYLAGYALLGLALLAKGPVPVAVVMCGALAYLAAAGRLRTVLAQARLLSGTALMLAVAGPWYGYELVHQPRFFATFFLGEHFGHLQGELARTQPAWGNLMYLAIYFYPWVAFLPAALVHAFRQPDRGHVLRLAAWWSLAVLVIFSLPQSKLAHYLAPAFPALALLVGAWLDEWLAGHTLSRGWAAAGFATLGIVGTLCGAGAVIAALMPPWLHQALARYGDWTPGWSPVVMLAAIGAGSLVAAVAAPLRRVVVAPALAGAMLLAGMVNVGWFVPRRAMIQAQPRKELALLLASALPSSEPVGIYYAKRNATVFYLGRPIVDLGETEGEFAGLVRFLSSPTPACALTHRRFVPALKQSLPGLSVLAERGDYVAVANHPPPALETGLRPRLAP